MLLKLCLQLLVLNKTGVKGFLIFQLYAIKGNSEVERFLKLTGFNKQSVSVKIKFAMGLGLTLIFKIAVSVHFLKFLNYPNRSLHLH